MDRAIHAAAPEQRRVRGVHSCVHVCFVMSASTTEIRLLLRSALMADHSIEARGTESRGAGFSPLHRPQRENAIDARPAFVSHAEAARTPRYRIRRTLVMHLRETQ